MMNSAHVITAGVRTVDVLRVLAVAFAIVVSASGQEPPQRTLIRNASVLDGTGAAPRTSDVRIVGDRIDGIGRLAPSATERVVDARGKALAPGFIDTHSHHSRGVSDQRDALAAVSQGITTIVVGQDGSSTMPLADFFSRLDREPAAVNVASYVGHGTIRRDVMGTDFKRHATPEEVDRMAARLRTEMAAGALGLSTGLEYDPGIYSTPEEVVALARVAGSLGGRYISHIRSEDRTLWQAVDEVITIGRAAHLPVQISHVKLAMHRLWGQAGKLVEVLDRARAGGVNVTADIYPYTYWQSGITVLFPNRDFANRAEADLVVKEVVTPRDLLITRFEPNPAYAGKTLAQIAAMRGSDAADALMAIIKEGEARGAAAGVMATSMDERDIARLMRWPFTNICTDGELSGPHPRGFGSFPRVLGKYVREQHVVPLPEAVRKMTGLAAANVGIAGRGTIAPGRYADLVLFDQRTVIDRATMASPHAVSEGIDTVWVNGEVVFTNGATTGKHPGKAIRRATNEVRQLVNW
jgi:N-acyl-D-amino-acid deacylase